MSAGKDIRHVRCGLVGLEWFSSAFRASGPHREGVANLRFTKLYIRYFFEPTDFKRLVPVLVLLEEWEITRIISSATVPAPRDGTALVSERSRKS